MDSLDQTENVTESSPIIIHRARSSLSSVTMAHRCAIRKRRVLLAPMMKVTDRHFRKLISLLCPDNTTLYTEMLNSNFLIRGDRERVRRALRGAQDVDSPTVLQIGGNCTEQFRQIASMCEGRFDAYNINAGCPSTAVAGKGMFGAALMRRPQKLGELANALREGCSSSHVPVSIKCRIGVVDRVKDVDDITYEQLANFIHRVDISSDRAVSYFDVHARAAVLGARFSPKQNREVPPLRYDLVYQLVRDFPHIRFNINGGVRTCKDALAHIGRGVHGVMIGRLARDAPLRLAEIDRALAHDHEETSTTTIDPLVVVDKYVAYVEKEMRDDPEASIRALLSPLVNLFQGKRGAKAYRRCLSETISQEENPSLVIRKATSEITAFRELGEVGCFNSI